jgi:hypothetical protein
MYRIEVIDGVATMVPRDAPAPAPAPELCALPEDTIVLRLNKPLKVIKAAEEPEEPEEVELEVREIDEPEPVPDFSPQNIGDEKYRYPNTIEGVVEEFARAMIREDEECFIKKTELYGNWKDWYQVQHGKHIPKATKLYDYMTNRFGKLTTKGWPKCSIDYEDDEEEDAREVVIPAEFAYEPMVEYGGQKIYRHETHKDYGCCFETGEIYRFNHKKNVVAGKLAVNIKNGITLSLGFDEDGSRRQKHYGTHNFVGEVALQHGKIKQISALHTKIAINTACEAYKKRPFIKLYPLDCLVLTTDGTIDPNKKRPYDPMGYGGAGMSDGASLRDRVKTADQIDEFMAQIRRENEKLKNKIESRDEEIKKLKEQLQEKNDENNKLKDEIERYNEHSNKPLTAGAIQLQELLMTEHQGSTVLEMLQFCFKDITRNYPKANDDYERDDADADFGIFEMSPRGLSDRNEIITR